MGALIGQQEPLDVGDRLQEAGLGIEPGTITAATTAATSIIPKIFGGSSCSGSDRQKRQQMEQQIAQYLNYSDRQELVGVAESSISPTPKDMAHFFVGGKDCKHKNVSPGDRQFLNQLPKRIAQRRGELEPSHPHSGSGLPANMSVATASLAPPLKYVLYGIGALGVGTAAYAGYNKFIKN
ncbi:hypothetical protein [Halalkalibaculum sp. DA384]|uniref:hypothetical protein n=1 Tax=Halalkalibaculum sp. DA384 TaxID=3373606 RepID=UPI003754FB83